MKVTSRFKGSDPADRVPEELWTELHNTVQEAVTKTIPKTKKCKRAKWLSEEALQIVEEIKEAKSNRERGRYTQMNTEFQRMARRDKKAFFNEQCKVRKTIEWERRSLQENWRYQGNISCQYGHHKGQKEKGHERNRRD